MLQCVFLKFMFLLSSARSCESNHLSLIFCCYAPQISLHVSHWSAVDFYSGKKTLPHRFHQSKTPWISRGPLWSFCNQKMTKQHMWYVTPTCRFWGYILLMESLEMFLNLTKSAPRSEAVTAAFILPRSPAAQRSTASIRPAVLLTHSGVGSLRQLIFIYKNTCCPCFIKLLHLIFVISRLT